MPQTVVTENDRSIELFHGLWTRKVNGIFPAFGLLNVAPQFGKACDQFGNLIALKVPIAGVHSMF